jgi:hypothetical protein
MRYASQDFMNNMFGGYSPAKQLVKNRRRAEMERMEKEAMEAMENDHECGCKK